MRGMCVGRKLKIKGIPPTAQQILPKMRLKSQYLQEPMFILSIKKAELPARRKLQKKLAILKEILDIEENGIIAS